MGRFRKKPIEVDASQWFKPGDHPAVRRGYINTAGSIVDPTNDLANVADFHPTNVIKTLEGWHEVSIGDWIVRGIKGELYPVKPDIFIATYEPVERASSKAGETR